MIRIKFFLTLILAVASVSYASAQLGIRAGVNMANEIQTFDQEGISNAFHNDNLTGYQVGLVYQFNPKNRVLDLNWALCFHKKGVCLVWTVPM